MRDRFAIHSCAALLTVLTALTAARAQPPAKPLTQDELLRQIDSLNPAPSAASRRNPAVAPDGARAEVRNSAAANPLSSDLPEQKTEKAPKREKGPTAIEALEATFDQKEHLAVFVGEVVVTDPEFTVLSDRLTAYLKRDAKPVDEPGPTRLRAPVAAEANAVVERKKSSGLEKAVAEADPGRTVTVTQEKKELDGSTSRSVGHGRKVVFDSVTGDITLTGRPDVQQGFNTCVATDDSTVMVLNRDGHMRVTGPHKTVIKDQGDLSK